MDAAVMVGVDVAKATFDVALVLGTEKYRTKAKLGNDAQGHAQFLDWLNKHAGTAPWVVMEATGVYHEALATFLVEHAVRVSVVNPARVAAYARSELSRSKTDKADAKMLARFAQGQQERLMLWTPAPPSQRRLRALVRRLQDLQELAQIERNRLDVADAIVKPSIEAMLHSLQEQITATLKAIRAQIDDDSDLRGRRDVLTSIPGIADTTAALLLAELGDVHRFGSANDVVAFAGLNPHLHESGTLKGRARISKIGSARLRAGLYMPALSAARANPILRAFAERLRARGKAGKVVICAVMRKMLHIAYGVLKSGLPFDAQHGLANA